jgi:anthranilate phosphoribosyltransferase
MMGVYSRELLEPMAQVLRNLGLKRALVVHGNDGLDEITTTDKTFVSEFNGQEIISYDIDPDELGIPHARIEDLMGGDAVDNAALVRRILEGEKGPRRNIVLVNAAYALYTAQAVGNLEQGIRMAEHAIDSRRALQKLEELKEFSNRVR